MLAWPMFGAVTLKAQAYGKGELFTSWWTRNKGKEEELGS